MLKRIVATVVLALTLATGATVASAYSHHNDRADYDWDSSSQTSASDDIWVGMCVGASLDLSSASEKNCERKQRVLEERGPWPYKEPNIEASLCLGASLNLSRASAANCAAQTADEEDRSENYQPTRSREYVYVDEAPASPTFQYAALGDSVAAGAGLPESDNPGDAACDRSAQAYPYHIAAERGYDFVHVACSGATMGNLLTAQSSTDNPAQLDSVFATGTPQVITITAGANNVRWSSVLLKCLRGTCGTSNDNRAAQAAIAAVRAEMRAVLAQIAQRSGGSPPKVMFTGYYNPLPANCAANESRLTSEEVAWVDAQLKSLNNTLHNAAADSSFASFVPIDFGSHGICSPNPWVQDTNDPAPLHPTAAGQQVIARAILANL